MDFFPKLIGSFTGAIQISKGTALSGPLQPPLPVATHRRLGRVSVTKLAHSWAMACLRLPIGHCHSQSQAPLQKRAPRDVNFFPAASVALARTNPETGADAWQTAVPLSGRRGPGPWPVGVTGIEMAEA